MAGSPALSAGTATAAGSGNSGVPSSTSMPSVASATSISSVSQENGVELPNEEEVAGSEAVEKELCELLGKMEESYKEFSETVFKKMDSMREKIAVLDESVVDLNEGLENLESLDSPSSSGKSRSAMQRKRRA